MGDTIDLRTEVEAALFGTGTIPRADYERWICGDLPTRARVYALTESHWFRIDPEPSGLMHCGFMADYLIECVLQNPESDDFVHSGFEAAYEIAAWLKHLATIRDGLIVLTDVADRLGKSYKVSDELTRNRIQTGVLEHALESTSVRPFFRSWGTDPILQNAYKEALAWGVAHTAQDSE